MKQTLLTILRDRHSTCQQFREAADLLTMILASESAEHIPLMAYSIETPMSPTVGVRLPPDIVLIPILRAGLSFLPSFLKFYPHASVGFIGIRRHEETAIAKHYYSNLPRLKKETYVLLLDPMLATGGSACLAIKEIIQEGALESHITLVSAIAAPEGLAHLNKVYPEVKTVIGKRDEKLDEKKFIVPGLGDFGNRYFGTSDDR